MSSSSTIVRAAIHPAIGVARVGNSPTGCFFGPEVPGKYPETEFRDSNSRIKRQAARFRIFGLNANGHPIQEITAANAEIEWSVHIANSKAAWFNFDAALDIPASQGQLGGDALTSTRRNADVLGAERQKLVIDPGEKTISGRSTNKNGGDPTYAFEGGAFFEKRVYLGEIRTDEMGRLILLGGHGDSSSHNDEPLSGATNNDGWHDDVADGPVIATVRIDGQQLVVTGAWIIVAPPNYAPGIRALVTGYDLALQVAMKLSPELKPKRPTFSQHIYPIFHRLTQYQWVNAGFARDFGSHTRDGFTNPEMIERLNDRGHANRLFRRGLFDRFRDAAFPQSSAPLQANLWPAVYGDAFSLDTRTNDPRAWFAILESQYEWLRQWAEGDFVDDGLPEQPDWDRLSAADQAAALDRAALEEMTGGPFHPGSAFTWPLRIPRLYEAPFRIKHRTGPEPEWGTALNSTLALSEGGPLDGSVPGSLTRWLAVPWQTDTVSCLSAYLEYAGDYVPTFWPARVPNDVLSQESYDIMVSPDATPAQRDDAFHFRNRKKWLRDIEYEDEAATPPTRVKDPDPLQTFLDQWANLGIVTQRPGPSNESAYPDQLWVETGRKLDTSGANAGESGNDPTPEPN